MTLTQFVKQRRDEIIRRWRNNEISLIEGARELVSLGYPPLTAWAILEKA